MRTRRQAALGPVVVLAAVALLGVVLDRPAMVVGALVGAAVVVQLALVAPTAFARAEHRVTSVVGAAVRVVLLLPLWLLVFVPVGLVSRLLGMDALGHGPRWVPRPAGVSGRRTYARDRGTGRAGLGWRAGLALVGTGALLAVVLPRVLDGGSDEIPTALQGDVFNANASPALADAGWIDEASREFAEAAAEGATYTPYVAASSLDYEGRYVNIEDRQRRSYRPEVPPGRDPVVVWFFGGSTMFGFSAQRDQHTIPSEVARVAETDGVLVEAHNYGSPGFVSFQEAVLCAQLLLAGERPDLIVFYDGINDLAVQVQAAFAGTGHLGEPSDLSAVTMRRLLAGELTGTDALPVPLTPPVSPGRPPRAEAVVEGTLRVYRESIELVDALAERDGVPVVRFWQPTIYTKQPLVEGERELLEPLHLDPFRFDALAAITAELRRRLPPGVVDLSTALDDQDEPILSDQVHTNELGAHLIAEAMYRTIGDQLQGLAGEG